MLLWADMIFSYEDIFYITIIFTILSSISLHCVPTEVKLVDKYINKHISAYKYIIVL